MPQTEAKQVIRFGTFEVDPHTGELRKNGVHLKLQDQPFHVLLALLEKPGEIVTREELRTRLWPADTFVDFDHGLNAAVKRLRDALGDTAENPRFIETLAKRGYRLLVPLNRQTDAPSPVGSPVESAGAVSLSEKSTSGTMGFFDRRFAVDFLARHRIATLSGIALVVLAVAGLGLAAYRRSFHIPMAHALTDKDTILIADFTNPTGDGVFDDTLRQGLIVLLEQSPFLSLISDQRIQQTLPLMEQPADTKLTPQISREICLRLGSAATIEGAIAQIGTHYSLILRAVSCANGESLTSTEAEANDKSDVFAALRKAATELRKKLGESLSTVQTFDTPLELATTSSLEALQAYSLGRKSLNGGNASAAIPLFQRAIRMDPNFAMAYASLGQSYTFYLVTSLPAENTRKAYELRERVSEREKFYIESHYHDNVTGDLEKARAVYELWTQVYPRDSWPHGNLAGIYSRLGQHVRALEQLRERHRLEANGLSYQALVYAYNFLNRFEEARASVTEAQARDFDSPELHFAEYHVAFLQNDSAAMKEQVDWAAAKQPEDEWMQNTEAWTAAYSGRIKKSREFFGRGVAFAERVGNKEGAALYKAGAAWREADLGNATEARQQATAALALSRERNVQCAAALALAATGDAARAQTLADDLSKRFPEATVVRFTCVPTIHARAALSRNNPSKAIELLQVAAPTELGIGDYPLYVPYVRGEAYMAAHQATEAAAEFQKVLDHRGIVHELHFGALAHLQIGRAYAMQGDTAKAKTAYQDFLTLWKDADPDIPILIAAKAEYAKLQ